MTSMVQDNMHWSGEKFCKDQSLKVFNQKHKLYNITMSGEFPDHDEPQTILHFNETSGSDKTLNQEGYRRVIENLRNEGVEPLVVRGTPEFNIETGLVVPHRIVEIRDGEGTRIQTVRDDESEPVEFGTTSIRDYRPRAYLQAVEAAGANVVNTAAVRELDYKDTAYKLISDLQPRTLILEPSEFYAQLHAIRGSRAVLKPVGAAGGRGRLIASKADLINPNMFHLQQQENGYRLKGETDPPIDLDLTENYLLQEFIDTKQPFPPGIELIDSCRPFYDAHQHDRKEVRLMMYWDQSRPDSQKIIPFGRIFTPKAGAVADGTGNTEDDSYLLIDIEKGLPSDLHHMSTDVMNRIAESRGATYIHGAIDCVFDGQRWYVMELNLWQPVPPSYKEAREHGAESLAEVHRASLARLMADAARDAQAANKLKYDQ